MARQHRRLSRNEHAVHLLRGYHGCQRGYQSRIFIAATFDTANEVRTMALYACARSLALVLASAVPFFTGSTSWLQAIACCMIIVQVCDAGIGVAIKDRMKTFGPAGTALLNLAALIWLLS